MGTQRDEKGQFIKGNKSGGRPPLPEEIRQMLQESKEEFIESTIRHLRKNVKETKKLNMDSLTMLERFVVKSFVDNNIYAIKYILDRLYGKPKESIDLDLTDPEGIKIIVEYK